MPIAQRNEDATDRGPGRDGLLEDPAPRAVPTDELCHPRHHFDRDVTDRGLRIADCGIVCAHGTLYVPHREGIRNSKPRDRSVSGRGLPVFRSYPTVSYQTSSIRSQCEWTDRPFAGPSTGVEPYRGDGHSSVGPIPQRRSKARNRAAVRRPWQTASSLV